MASRAITQWLCWKASTFASRDGATKADQMMYTCISSYYSMIALMNEAPRILNEQQAEKFLELTLRHLRSYVWLHKFGMQATRHVPGRRCFLLMPKLHHLWHLGFDTYKFRINPRSTQLLSAESFIGVVGRIARACHRSTVSKRTLERYLCKLHLVLRPNNSWDSRLVTAKGVPHPRVWDGHRYNYRRTVGKHISYNKFIGFSLKHQPYSCLEVYFPAL